MTDRKVKMPKHNSSWMGDLMFRSLQHQTLPIHLNHNPPYFADSQHRDMHIRRKYCSVNR